MWLRFMSAAQPHILITTDAIGGVWRYSTDLASQLQSLGWKVTLLCLGPPPDAAERRLVLDQAIALHETALPLDWLAATEGDIVFAADALADWAAKLQVDSVHLHSPAYAVSRRFDRPVVAVNHSCLATWWSAIRGPSPMPNDFRWRAELHHEGLLAADRILCPSASFAKLTCDQYGLPTTPIAILNGRKPLPEGWEVAPLRVRVFTCGRLWDEAKNIALVDRAAARIEVRIHVAGADRAPTGQRATVSNLALLGQLDGSALAGILAQQPIYIASSRYEPFGLSVLEAAAFGCPLVLSDIPTFRELWEGAAIFVHPSDEIALAEVVNTLLADAVARADLGHRARQRALGYSIDAMADAVAAVHRQVSQRVREDMGALS
jgi:glycosyltransferase involved in cell wall biosynthesis